MKTKIGLAEFIEQVKAEVLNAAQKPKTQPFFELNDVELEVSFSAEATAGGGFSFFIDLTGEVKTAQTHTVRLKFQPRLPAKTSAGGGGLIMGTDPSPDDDGGPGWVKIKVDEILGNRAKAPKGNVPVVVVGQDGKIIMQNFGKKNPPWLKLNPNLGYIPGDE